MPSIVITGGQTGADQAAWRAAKACGVPTGGWMPRGFKTETGPRPEFAAMYGAKEYWSDDYATRTQENVLQADFLILFGNPYSRGGKLVMRLCETIAFIDYMVVIHSRYATPERAAEWVTENADGNEGRLMVAGNRASVSSAIGGWVEAYMRDVFRLIGKELASS